MLEAAISCLAQTLEEPVLGYAPLRLHFTETSPIASLELLAKLPELTLSATGPDSRSKDFNRASPFRIELEVLM